MKHLSIAILWLCCWLCSCQRNTVVQSSGGDTLQMKYARLLTLIHHDDYEEAIILNPWEAGKVLHRYLLVPRESLSRWKDTSDATVVGVPLERSVVFTASHAYLLAQLDAADAIAGVCDSRYMHNPVVAQQMTDGRTIDCGDGMHPNLERILQTHAQALFLSPFEHSGGYGAVEKLNIPLIECADYMEQTALGRAEWMKFYGMLVGRKQQADSLFTVVENQYNILKGIAAKTTKRPMMLTERKTGSVWYCPGGKSTMSSMLQDAHATHLLTTDKHSGSVPLSPEKIILNGQKIDCWAFHDDQSQRISYQSLLAEWHGYKTIKAFQQHNIYVCNSMTTNYFDEIPFRPDFLLRELIIMLHPELMPDDTLKYYQRL